ncbi:hypothetical protein TNCV_1860441 [Trichonephila clavipes]|nr:hypothetical protein TNCV_1860441 [Trichonephila clavipes]
MTKEKEIVIVVSNAIGLLRSQIEAHEIMAMSIKSIIAFSRIQKNPKGPELANMVSNVAKIIAKLAENLATKYDVLALSTRSHQVPIDVTSCYPFPFLFTKSLRQISSNREERCYTSKIELLKINRLPQEK